MSEQAVVFARIVDAPLEVALHESAVAHSAAGATALFIGTVRDHDPDAVGQVERLEYSAHPDASAVLQRIAEEVSGRRDGVRVAVSHRIGSLEVGDHALIAAVSAPHRAEAFDACRDLVERVKHEVPIWKKQYAADGTTSWIGLG
ncbi:MAG TPA: molybdenum cofactor biosynthesis protein MoaE [Humibacter sp.]|nr:molybdenum cofactor biosynthesis protein MoaE [Humibacter sp.]